MSMLMVLVMLMFVTVIECVMGVFMIMMFAQV